MNTRTLAFIAAVGLALPAGAATADDPQALARELARLRSDVERLSQDLQARRERADEELQTLSAQRRDLDLELQKEELRLARLREAAERRREELSEEAEKDAALAPAARMAADALEASMRTRLPFKVEERLADLRRIERQMAEGLLGPTQALAHLWERVEDELRLSRETGLYQQVVEVDGSETLADVARVGMVMLFFRSPDGRYGYAEDTGSGWTWVALGDGDDRRRVQDLFDALEKQIRAGFFVLPNALPENAR